MGVEKQADGGICQAVLGMDNLGVTDVKNYYLKN